MDTCFRADDTLFRAERISIRTAFFRAVRIAVRANYAQFQAIPLLVQAISTHSNHALKIPHKWRMQHLRGYLLFLLSVH